MFFETMHRHTRVNNLVNLPVASPTSTAPTSPLKTEKDKILFKFSTKSATEMYLAGVDPVSDSLWTSLCCFTYTPCGACAHRAPSTGSISLVSIRAGLGAAHGRVGHFKMRGGSAIRPKRLWYSVVANEYSLDLVAGRDRSTGGTVQPREVSRLLRRPTEEGPATGTDVSLFAVVDREDAAVHSRLFLNSNRLVAVSSVATSGPLVLYLYRAAPARYGALIFCDTDVSPYHGPWVRTREEAKVRSLTQILTKSSMMLIPEATKRSPRLNPSPQVKFRDQPLPVWSKSSPCSKGRASSMVKGLRQDFAHIALDTSSTVERISLSIVHYIVQGRSALFTVTEETRKNSRLES
ncbi:hypothetical protein BDV98DRAFT_587049 [Pterulicium gracile]|uniref:Uncharacterized protein n=1 Tax=Pterulicium gracile TaxID=1884261 RepID=A0A5C3Q504_9AGAR|nr:hypothetical protein BDV98DRAFT_587049 [Pterula gracilis]